MMRGLHPCVFGSIHVRSTPECSPLAPLHVVGVPTNAVGVPPHRDGTNSHGIGVPSLSLSLSFSLSLFFLPFTCCQL